MRPCSNPGDVNPGSVHTWESSVKIQGIDVFCVVARRVMNRPLCVRLSSSREMKHLVQWALETCRNASKRSDGPQRFV